VGFFYFLRVFFNFFSNFFFLGCVFFYLFCYFLFRGWQSATHDDEGPAKPLIRTVGDVSTHPIAPNVRAIHVRVSRLSTTNAWAPERLGPGGVDVLDQTTPPRPWEFVRKPAAMKVFWSQRRSDLSSWTGAGVLRRTPCPFGLGHRRPNRKIRPTRSPLVGPTGSKPIRFVTPCSKASGFNVFKSRANTMEIPTRQNGFAAAVAPRKEHGGIDRASRRSPPSSRMGSAISQEVLLLAGRRTAYQHRGRPAPARARAAPDSGGGLNPQPNTWSEVFAFARDGRSSSRDGEEHGVFPM